MANAKALISFAATAKLICVFVFAYAKSRFSHNAAQLVFLLNSVETIWSLIIIFDFIYINDSLWIHQLNKL